MASKLVNNVDEKTWRKIKIISAIYGLTVSETLKMLVRNYEAQKGAIGE